MTLPQQEECKAAAKKMKAETLVPGLLASEMRTCCDEAKEGSIDFAKLFALIMQIMSLLPFKF